MDTLRLFKRSRVYRQMSYRGIARINYAVLVRLYLKVNYLLRHPRKGNLIVKSDRNNNRKSRKEL